MARTFYRRLQRSTGKEVRKVFAILFITGMPNSGGGGSGGGPRATV
jgi:hypothetical protein